MALMIWFCPLCKKYIVVEFSIEDNELKKKLKTEHDKVTPGCKNRQWD